jgi:FAD/FMN-containing dehydrogenase
VTGFELISRMCIDLVLKHIPNMRDPLSAPSPWYVLVELSDSTTGSTLDTLLEEALGHAAEAELVTDAVLAANDSQRKELWALRENVSEAQKLDGVSIKHDVSVPVSRIPEFIERASAALRERFPDIRIVAFGHMGDGNVHYNCGKSQADDASRFYGESPDVNHVVYAVVSELGGSISAEHGLGVLKVDEIKQYKSALELDLMRAIKRTLDPDGIMNPGKVL